MSLLERVCSITNNFKAKASQVFYDSVRQNLECKLDLAKRGIMIYDEFPNIFETGISAPVMPPINFDVNSEQGRVIIERAEQALAEFNIVHPAAAL
ncbi:MAG: hypothetical protein DYH13_11140 [Alphaproteobacteria bacterium PRO2]|nr:hypothetical protein [Alphaproteobacteria bacterium PRO2]